MKLLALPLGSLQKSVGSDIKGVQKLTPITKKNPEAYLREEELSDIKAQLYPYSCPSGALK